MNILSKNVPVAKHIARNVPIGQVYSWANHEVHYMRCDGGSVCLNTGEFLSDQTSGRWSAHFAKPVDVAHTELLTLEY